MQIMDSVTSKEDFVRFLTDDRLKIKYEDKVFTKNIKGGTLKIQQDEFLVCEVYEKRGYITQ